MSETSTLSPIYWIHRPSELSNQIEESDDLCAACVDVAEKEFKQKHPAWADEICADGGYEIYCESDSPATCARCGCKLSCCVEVDGKQMLIDTEEEWDAASMEVPA